MLLLFSGTASAQFPGQNPRSPGGNIPEQRLYTVRGWVSDATSHKRIEGVRVDLLSTTGGVIGTTFTRGNGEFSFDNVAPASYNLATSYAGYVNSSDQVEVTFGSVLGLDVELRRTPDSKDRNGNIAAGASKVSVRELSIPRKAREPMQNGLTLLYDKSDYQGSLKQFERAIQAYPDYYEAYAAMGMAYVRLQDEANAEQALHKSIEISHEKYGDALWLLAEFYSNDKRFAAAEPLARKAVELDSQSWQANSELARALVGLDQSEDAEESAAKAVELAPDKPQLRLILANVHMNEEDYSALLDDLNSYLNLAPNGQFAEQARKQRDEVQQRLAAEENPPSAHSVTQP